MKLLVCVVCMWDLMCLKSYSSSWILLAFLLISTHFLKALSVCSADEICLHIVYTTLWIHQVLIVFSFYLDHAHDHAVDHVDRFTFVFLAFAPFLVILDALLILFKVVLNTLSAIVINVISVVLKRGFSLVEPIILNVLLVIYIVLLLLMALLSARLELNVVHRVLISNIVVLRVEVLMLAKVINIIVV